LGCCRRNPCNRAFVLHLSACFQLAVFISYPCTRAFIHLVYASLQGSTPSIITLFFLFDPELTQQLRPNPCNRSSAVHLLSRHLVQLMLGSKISLFHLKHWLLVRPGNSAAIATQPLSRRLCTPDFIYVYCPFTSMSIRFDVL
jgi:hypothetical protein